MYKDRKTEIRSSVLMKWSLEYQGGTFKEFFSFVFVSKFIVHVLNTL